VKRDTHMFERMRLSENTWRGCFKPPGV